LKVILRADVEKLGKRGDAVKVADGYARNYLLPKGLALIETPGSLKIIEEEKKLLAVKQVKEKAEAEALSEKLKQVSLTIVKKVGENEVLYGSVTSTEIEELLKKEGIEVDRRKIELSEPIKTTGIFNVPIKIHPEVTSEIKVWVVKE
jgi:large subunit ribosomal protein L9